MYYTVNLIFKANSQEEADKTYQRIIETTCGPHKDSGDLDHECPFQSSSLKEID